MFAMQAPTLDPDEVDPDAVLMQSVSVQDPESGQFRTYVPGAKWRSIPEADRALITNPSIFEKPYGFRDIDRASLDGPESIEDADVDELREIARAHGIDLGKLRREDAIRSVLREAGVE